MEHRILEGRDDVCHGAPECTPLMRINGVCINGHSASCRTTRKVISVTLSSADTSLRIGDVTENARPALKGLSPVTLHNNKKVWAALDHVVPRPQVWKFDNVLVARAL